MIQNKQIEIAEALIKTGFVEKVYHSAELIMTDKGSLYPVYSVGGESFDIGPDDTKKMFAYIRINGDVKKSSEELIGSCSKGYYMAAPCRVVFFQDKCDADFQTLVNVFLSVGFIKDVTLLGYTTDKYKLIKIESKLGDYNFDAQTFYMAIDVQIKYLLTVDNCEKNICITTSNPICK